ncbi:ABC transporter permease subunit [Miniphocaeibacter halophilus]|uniref:ABC transporter permease subunit n=1 Tax=Miniphocaeibacter halophilus TaxID=2931922 RepID=A0AC61MRL7_9FIRM|nr:ABC transporter permease subunit [Miniphocaeibacter halophilus]QQK07230.1 ABC transporter permease subunit [Miniphocaeibacter halophilus]
MIILKHELKLSRFSLFIWTSILTVLMVIIMLIYPEMKKDMDGINNLFENMGSFSSAFGMDQINIGTAMGYYGIEAENVIGIAGGFFAALLGISILSKEEKDRTAEFLLSHPISRSKIVYEKFLSVIIQILILNIVITLFSAISFFIIDEKLKLKEFLLLHIAFLIMQIEIGSICFGLSAFFRKSGLGVGIGLTAILYFCNIIKNITTSADFLKYITPYGYTEVSYILTEGKLDLKLIGLGLLYALVFVIFGFIKYIKKDIYV